jgi:hypothetical protein
MGWKDKVTLDNTHKFAGIVAAVVGIGTGVVTACVAVNAASYYKLSVNGRIGDRTTEFRRDLQTRMPEIQDVMSQLRDTNVSEAQKLAKVSTDKSFRQNLQGVLIFFEDYAAQYNRGYLDKELVKAGPAPMFVECFDLSRFIIKDQRNKQHNPKMFDELERMVNEIRQAVPSP